MLALTSTRAKELHNELVQSIEYCHFVLAFDSDNNVVKEYNDHKRSNHTIQNRSPGERHFRSRLG